MASKVLINIFGPSTAGKSTIAEKIQDSMDRIYTVDFDVIKRQISGYQWKRDRDVAWMLTFDTLASVANTDLSVLALLPPPTQEHYDRLAEITKAGQFTLLNIEITAPPDVLIKRYQERMEKVRQSGSKWNFKTLDEFKAKLQEGYYRPSDTISFDSSTNTAEEIFDALQTRL